MGPRLAPPVALLGAAVAWALAGCGGRGLPPEGVLRLGHFPNVTHAQALVARQMSRQGKGWFEPRLGVKIEWTSFNAGPTAMEAMLAGAIDATWVGPSPALNAHARTGGHSIRVVAGAAYGGSGLVVREGAGIRSAADFRGRTILTPQLGNTQDVACRAWLRRNGLAVTLTGGDATVAPTPNPEHLPALLRGSADASWTVEPWLTRLETEAKATVLLLEPDAVTTVLVASRALLEGRRTLARALVDAHEELTAWISAHPDEAQRLAREEIEAITGRPFDPGTVARAWGRLRFSAEIAVAPFAKAVAEARVAGVLESEPPLDTLVERP